MAQVIIIPNKLDIAQGFSFEAANQTQALAIARHNGFTGEPMAIFSRLSSCKVIFPSVELQAEADSRLAEHLRDKERKLQQEYKKKSIMNSTKSVISKLIGDQNKKRLSQQIQESV